MKLNAVKVTVDGEDRKMVAIALEDAAAAFEQAIAKGHPSKHTLSVWKHNAAALREYAREVRPSVASD